MLIMHMHAHFFLLLMKQSEAYNSIILFSTLWLHKISLFSRQADNIYREHEIKILKLSKVYMAFTTEGIFAYWKLKVRMG